MRRFLLFLVALFMAAPAYAQLTEYTVIDGLGATITLPTSQIVVNELNAGVHGGTAADSPIADNPLTVGGRGSATTPSAMSADGDVTHLWLTLNGATVTAGDVLDDAAYAPATSRPFVAAGVADDTGTDSVNEGDAGYLRMSPNRMLYGMIGDGDGNERWADVTTDDALKISCFDCVGAGAVDAAVPSSVMALGFAANGSSAAGTLDTQRLIGCTDSAVISTNASGNVELVALTASATVYVCGWQIVATGAVAVQLITGTGTACATDEANLTGAMPIAANGILTFATPFHMGLKGAVSSALCIETSSGVQIDGVIFYTKA